jgi:hypothetical protein
VTERHNPEEQNRHVTFYYRKYYFNRNGYAFISDSRALEIVAFVLYAAMTLHALKR